MISTKSSLSHFIFIYKGKYRDWFNVFFINYLQQRYWTALENVSAFSEIRLINYYQSKEAKKLFDVLFMIHLISFYVVVVNIWVIEIVYWETIDTL